ncbi:hypothetical protein GCM10027082_24300 [Comamonas humi]
MNLIQRFLALFSRRASMPAAPVQKPRKAATTADFVLMRLRLFGDATSSEMAESINANVGTVTNVFTQLKREGKVVAKGKDGREVIWGLA